MNMNTEEILSTVERIRKLVQELSVQDGTMLSIDPKLQIALELCEQLLLDAQDRMNKGKSQEF